MLSYSDVPKSRRKMLYLTRPMMKWNQEDLGKAPHRRQGICTSVRGPSPRPSGKHKTTWHWSWRAILATIKDEATNLQARKNSRSGDWDLIGLCIRLWIVPVFINWLLFEIEFYKSLKKIVIAGQFGLLCREAYRKVRKQASMEASN